eukprot:SAG22_NODE_11929_length_463_cov_0.851648_1_plen_126_part_10
MVLSDLTIDQPSATAHGDGLYIEACPYFKLTDVLWQPNFTELQTVHTVGSALNGCDDVDDPCPLGHECVYKDYSIKCDQCDKGEHFMICHRYASSTSSASVSLFFSESQFQLSDKDLASGKVSEDG